MENLAGLRLTLASTASGSLWTGVAVAPSTSNWNQDARLRCWPTATSFTILYRLSFGYANYIGLELLGFANEDDRTDVGYSLR